MKFIHTADLHLDTPFRGLQIENKEILNKIKNSTFNAFKNIVDIAIKQEVDFIIIAGDLYDSDVQSVTAQLFLNDQFLRLKEKNITVYVIFGNHDFSNSQIGNFEFPDNVFIFPAEVKSFYHTAKDGTRVELVGFSYPDRWVNENKVEQYPKPHSDIDYTIGILHGALKTGHDDNYAPFSKDELLEKGYDYWALGHIHERQILNEDPYIVYPGNPQGRSIKEDGSKGFYLVETNNKETEINFLPSDVIEWDKVIIDGRSLVSMSDVQREIDLNLNELSKTVSHFVSVMIKNANNLPLTVVKSIEDDSFAGGIAPKKFEDNYNIVFKVSVQITKSDVFSELDQSFWNRSADKIFSSENLEKEVLPLLKNYRFLQELVRNPEFTSTLQNETFELINERKSENDQL
ncbi:metallophosphoesterase family protein [Xylocopilactobacillus apis]|uniref:Calcineurin-like phosphoesterase domain-containing protein n=1 Tax=Xylocopilactobacillus apis TaxID=2932183 RepID=A0AAU9CYE1_9LACO|nr:DNA repair exonuclease [Xylocopilactobacillus apis]BDR56409.1 hypothetical protein KIMC2_09710 [Xylocopilactobacillus apis]